MEMKIAVIGSRGFTDQELLFKTLDKLPGKEVIVSGGAKGADKLAEVYAKERGIETEIYLPEYDRYGRGAPLKRNLKIVDAADLVVAFWDGKSRGTKFGIDYAGKQKKKVIIVNT
jgi:hypothetical protein